MIKSYKDLEVWKKSVELVKEIYNITKKFPKEEQFGITSQMRRCSISISSNISEGKTRQYVNEYIQFLYIALGSCSEINTQTIIAKELNFIKQAELDLLSEKIDHVSRMIRNLIKSLRH
ncbi:MAG: four helix bundle protein [Omnitrophica bacterium]|nr:four helix bundle protein [Candidatus Omnitrophota bacterium]